ncbi:YbaB/EbfC family nucleoid-associated protein [Spirillospora sp. NPDC029432]|uniref:YbaB/EbfC family nucleoid-associated protein n=1 Tax=Spirillospora sp. NPDC029432 TaxID=3154599 RepID=UPI003451218C
MREEWQAHIDELLERYKEQRQQLKDLQERIESVGATGEAADGMVKVTVGAQGQLTNVELDPRVYRKLASEELAEAVLAASQDAFRKVGEQRREAMAGAVPEEMLGGDVDKLLPADLTNIDAVIQRYGLRGK